MHPELIPGFPIQTYGVCVALGFWLAWQVVNRLAGSKEHESLIFLLLVCGLVGARLTHVIEYWHEDRFDEHLSAVFQIWNGGLVFYGGLIGGIVAFLGWCLVKRRDVLPLADLLCVAIPLGHAFGRLGCFFYGCCWGRCSDSALAVSFPLHSGPYNAQRMAGEIPPTALASNPVLPTQLFEAAALLVLFAGLYFLYRRTRAWTAATYMCGYGVIRFALEFLRDDARPSLWGLSSAQHVSLLLIVSGIAFFIWSYSRHVRPASDHR